MPLKAVLPDRSAIDALEAPFRNLYKEQNGRFVIDVQGVVLEDDFEEQATKLAEFRDNNRRLFKENESFKQQLGQFEGIDPEKYTTTLKELETFKKSGVNRPDDITKQIAEAVAQATQPLQDQVASIMRERDDAKGQLTQKSQEDSLWQIGIKSGVEDWARTDFIRRAREVFKYEDGKNVAYQGDQPLYSKRRNQTTQPLTPDEWAMDLLPKEAPGLFKGTSGSGSRNQPVTNPNGARVVSNDPLAFGSNLEAIAKGEAMVVNQ